MLDHYTFDKDAAIKKFGYQGYDGSSWCASDFYEKFEEKLTAALATGESFCTGWLGVKKEIVSFCITRIDGKCWAEVSQSMDDAPGLVDTAIWEAAGKNDVCSCGSDWLGKNGYDAQEEVDEIIDGYLEGRGEFCENAEVECEPTLDSIKAALDKAEGITGKLLQDTYEDLVDYMRYRYFEKEEDE